MNNKQLLSEENYQKGKKKIMFIALTILIIGLLIGGSLIFTGIKNQSDVNSNYSRESKSSLSEQLTTEKQNLENRKLELESKGITYDAFTEYDEREAYELKVITEVLDPSINYCLFDEYKNNTSTLRYCSLKNQLDNISDDFNKKFDSFGNIKFFMFGGFIIIATFMISGFLFLFGKRREITAFTAQQIMPVAKEGIEEMAPTLGNVAEEVTKGIKKGTDDNSNIN